MTNKSFYDRFNELLEAYAPADLYRRALAIMIIPVVLLQFLLAGVLVARYLENVANVLASSLSDEVSLLVQLYDQSDRSDKAVIQIQNYAEKHLQMRFAVTPEQVQRSFAPPQFLAITDQRLRENLNAKLKIPFSVDTRNAGGEVVMRLGVEPNRSFVLSVGANRAQAVGTPLLLLFMALTTLAFMGIAVVFMRNQIKPILDLTAAAQDFGKGRENVDFKPEGASEVRLAGEAFLDMKLRIARHVEQRTALLAGVSHDLRTILTRFKLELAVLGDTHNTKALRGDVNEMQAMLEDYMAFVRGDGGEQASYVLLPDLCAEVIDRLGRDKTRISLNQMPKTQVMVKPQAFRRLLRNILENALRFAKQIEISATQKGEWLTLIIDDNGPGIPSHLRGEVFKPFTRLDAARNLDHAGSGLGLAIALDIAHAHGGEISLGDSEAGGLRVAVKVPV